MELNDYQQKAMSTCLPSCNNISYMALGLGGEMGELQGKLAKHIRKGNIVIEGNEMKVVNLSDGDMHDLLAEIGDCLWFCAGITSVLGQKLNDIAEGNVAKLASRKQRGVLDGNGDNR